MKVVAAIVAGILGAVLLAVPAQAASYIYVQNEASTSWPVLPEVKFVDGYASSIIQYRACRANVRCIKIFEKNLGTAVMGKVHFVSHAKVEITLNSYYRSRVTAEKAGTVAHELFHAVTYTTNHYDVCTNVMYHSSRCPNGSIRPKVFTPWGKYKLSQF